MTLKDSKYVMEVSRTHVNSAWWNNSRNKACISQNSEIVQTMLRPAYLNPTCTFPLISHVILSRWQKGTITCELSEVVRLPIKPGMMILWVNVHGDHRTLLHRVHSSGCQSLTPSRTLFKVSCPCASFLKLYLCSAS